VYLSCRLYSIEDQDQDQDQDEVKEAKVHHGLQRPQEEKKKKNIFQVKFSVPFLTKF
jgi:hypothetical protein